MSNTQIKHADGRVTTLNRAKVEENRSWYAAEAARNADRWPSRLDLEMGTSRADILESSKAYRAQAERLTKVLEAIDAGVEMLPAHLCP